LTIIADDSSGFDNTRMDALPGVNNKERVKKLREVLAHEITMMTKEQRLGLQNAAEIRGKVMCEGHVYEKL
jgi:hypothetical protein